MNSKLVAEKSDPLIDEVRQIREKLSKLFNNDVEKLCDHLQEQEQQHPERLIEPGEKSKQAA